MSRPLALLILSDGKPGHRNQSLGLAEALARQVPAHHRVIELPALPRGKKILQALRIARENAPDWIIATGHGTHLAALVLSRLLHCRSIILMKPSWPTALFDACLIPRHDLIGKSTGRNIISTTGALNRITATREKLAKGLILIGGDSREFTCEPDALRDAISHIVKDDSIDWHVTDSRRSPAGFLASLAHLPITLHPHQTTGPDWLPQQLGESRIAWVTCDSVSMIYESLSSGAHVGLLPMKPLQPASKIQNAIAQLERDGRVTTLSDFRQTGSMKTSAPLAEADRCAKILLEKFPPFSK